MIYTPHISHGVLYISPLMCIDLVCDVSDTTGRMLRTDRHSVACHAQLPSALSTDGSLPTALPLTSSWISPTFRPDQLVSVSVSLCTSLLLPLEAESGRARARANSEKEQGIERQRERATARARERERIFIEYQEVTEGR